MPSYSVIVVTWESATYLAALVESMNLRLPAGPELIVVDNASTDDPELAASGWRDETRFIRMPENRGYGAAANVGVEAARGDVVVLLNPDTELLDSRLPALVRLAFEHRALVGPRLRNANGSVQPSASGPPIGPWPWVAAVVPGRIQPDFVRARTEPWRLRRTTTVAWLTGACIAGARGTMRELGPFDTALEMYGEDIDLCLRAAYAGVPSLFCPECCEVLHHGGASASRRYATGADHLIALTRRAVVRRAYGARRETSAWLAQRVNLRLRVTAKRLLGRDARRDASALKAARNARVVRDLPG